MNWKNTITIEITLVVLAIHYEKPLNNNIITNYGWENCIVNKLFIDVNKEYRK